MHLDCPRPARPKLNKKTAAELSFRWAVLSTRAGQDLNFSPFSTRKPRSVWRAVNLWKLTTLGVQGCFTVRRVSGQKLKR